MNFQSSVLDLELNPLFISKWSLAAGLMMEEISKLLQDSIFSTYRQKALIEKRVIKLLSVRSFQQLGTIMSIVTHSPVINPATQNVVALHIYAHSLDIFNLSSILANYYKNGELTFHKLKGPDLTDREKQVVFFFLLNLESNTIAEVLSKIENKRMTKNSIDQIFTKQLLPKFGVYSRKALYDKLYHSGYTRIIPQNILNEGIVLDITDYVIFY